MLTSQISSQNKSTQEVSCKLENGSKIGGKLEKVTDVQNPCQSLKQLSLRLHNFFPKKNFDTGFEISSVGIPEISPYTKSEQPRVRGKHLTRHQKRLRCCGYIATLRTRACNFWQGRQPLPRSLNIKLHAFQYNNILIMGT